MYESDLDQRNGDTIDVAIRRFFGLLLLLFGVGIAVWILVSLIGLLTSDSTPALVSAVVPAANQPVILELPDGKITLPREVFAPLGYLLVSFIYAIGAGLSGVLINGGTSLLQPDLAKLIRRTVEQLERTRKRK